MLDEMMPLFINILIWTGIGVFLLYSVRWFNKRAQKRLNAIFNVVLPETARPEDVRVKYHTYHGVLAWVTQQSHDFYLPPEEARDVLRKLRNFNMKYGISAYGFIFIPFLAYGNYWAQLRSINRQVSQRGRAF